MICCHWGRVAGLQGRFSPLAVVISSRRNRYFWRKFERWQERVKAVEEKRKTDASNRITFKDGSYITREIEVEHAPGKDPTNLSVAEQGGMAFETVEIFAQLRYLDLDPRYIRRYSRYQTLIALQFDQRFVPERQLFLGPDLAAAHFIVHRGGSVKFLGDETWHRQNDRGEYILPGKRVSNLFIEAIDSSNTLLMYEGFANLHGLQKIRYLRIANCAFVSDWCMSKMKQFSDSLEYLDLSGCFKLSADGLSALGCLKKLKYLRLANLPKVKNLGVVALRLEDCIPGLQVVGVDFDKQLEDFEKDQKLLLHPHVCQDARGNVFLKDDIGEMYYLRGNVPEHPIYNDYDEHPLFLSFLRKDPPAVPLAVALEVNKLSGGKLKHLLAGSPSGEWSQETERILEVDVRRMIDENRCVHPLLTSGAKPKHFWKDFIEKRKKALLEEPKESTITTAE